MRELILKGLEGLQQAPRRLKQGALLTMDLAVFPLLLWSALSLRLGEWVTWNAYGLGSFLAWTMLALVLAWLSGIYAAVVRVYGEHYLQSAALAAICWVVFGWALTWLPDMYALPRSVLLMTGFLWLLHLWLSRASIRATVAWLLRESTSAERRRIAVYGAGNAGRQLMAALQAMPAMRPVAFFDDNPQLVGTRLLGLPVLAGWKLAAGLLQHPVDEIILALPTAGRQRQRDIVEALESASLQRVIKIRVLPGLDEIVGGRVTLGDVREVDVLDLLGRAPVPVRHDLFAHHVADRVVMVTGAAGSIGSELCRQLLSAAPEHLVLFDHSEFGLYAIEQELLQRWPHARITPVLGTVLERERLSRVMRFHGVETVYHAAAYKHVPLVEANPFEGVRNNALGTWEAALAAREAGVEAFVLISTDKAVRPTNVMGASKRLAEMVLQAMAAEPPLPDELGTVFSMVRFGNVLGSSGSVIPRFRKQIAEGGPVTVTHPEITRYFMTIPEAAQLVIQAGAMARGGEVFLLEMGESVRIIDLARRMIRLSGFTERTDTNPEGDIEIACTGLRPGEKLYEELLIDENAVSRTEHPRIYQARESGASLKQLQAFFDDLEMLARERNTYELKRLLQINVIGYKPDFDAVDHSVGLPQADDRLCANSTW